MTRKECEELTCQSGLKPRQLGFRQILLYSNWAVWLSACLSGDRKIAVRVCVPYLSFRDCIATLSGYALYTAHDARMHAMTGALSIVTGVPMI